MTTVAFWMKKSVESHGKPSVSCKIDACDLPTVKRPCALVKPSFLGWGPWRCWLRVIMLGINQTQDQKCCLCGFSDNFQALQSWYTFASSIRTSPTLRFQIVWLQVQWNIQKLWTQHPHLGGAAPPPPAPVVPVPVPVVPPAPVSVPVVPVPVPVPVPVSEPPEESEPPPASGPEPEPPPGGPDSGGPLPDPWWPKQEYGQIVCM